MSIDPHGSEDELPCPDLAELRARATPAGWVITPTTRSGYIVSRWNLSRALPDLRAVADFLKQAGVRS